MFCHLGMCANGKNSQSLLCQVDRCRGKRNKQVCSHVVSVLIGASLEFVAWLDYSPTLQNSALNGQVKFYFKTCI